MYIYLTNVLMPSIPLHCKVSRVVILIFWWVLPMSSVHWWTHHYGNVMSSYAAYDYKFHVDIGMQKLILAEGGLHSSAGTPNHLTKITQLYYQSTKLNNVAVRVICTLYLATQGLCNPWTRLLIFIAFVPLFASVVVKRGASISYYSKIGKYIFPNVC